MRSIVNLLQILLISASTAVCALVAGIVAVFHRDTAVFYGTWVWSKSLAYICGMRVHVFGAERIDITKPKIYVSNHASHMDIPALFLALPIPVYFIAKQELRQVPFLGWFMHLVGMIFIDRSNPERAVAELEKAAFEVKLGKNILSFPEGTRSKTGEIQRFKRGTFKMALAHNIDIVPISLSGTECIVPAQSFEINSGDIYVNIGEPVRVADFAHYTEEELAAELRSRIVQLKHWSTSQAQELA